MENLNQYTRSCVVQHADLDFRRRMKPSALLRCVEQISAEHARAYGMDDAFFDAHHVAFLIGKQAMELRRPPRYMEQLRLTTVSEQSRRGSIKRVTTVTDEAGQTIARVDARWIVMDTRTGHILREPGWTVAGFWNETIGFELPQLVHKSKELLPAGERRAYYSLCDMNGHVNNSCYLDIACDALPPEALGQGPVRFVSIKYQRQVPMGESMEVFYAPSAEGWYVVGRREDKAAFECYLELGGPAEAEAENLEKVSK